MGKVFVMKQVKDRISERGSALIIIFLGITLFAALGFTISSMMRQGNPNAIPEQKAELYATEILDYARILRQAVQTLRIDGCTDIDISFENHVLAGYVNGTNTSCQVFHTDGGGLNYISISDDSLDSTYNTQSGFGDWTFSGASRITDIGSNTESELMLVFPYLEQLVCEAIAEKLDLNIPVIEDVDGVDITKFVGTYILSERYDNADKLVNGCINVTGGGAPTGYTFFQVLIPR